MPNVPFLLTDSGFSHSVPLLDFVQGVNVRNDSKGGNNEHGSISLERGLED
jgi:hypothetical protein